MKKIIMMLLAMMMLMPASVNAQNNKALQKALKKEYKTKMKEYKNGNWQIFGTTRSLDVALLKHYEKLGNLGDDAVEVLGIAVAKSKNLGVQAALNSAANVYARQAGSTVKGRVVSDMASNGDDVSAEFDHFYAAYEALVEKEIKGELQPSFTIIRDTKDPSGNAAYEFQTYFIVNEDAATRARIRAYENALKESEAAQKYATKVSEFIKEGFKVEQ